MGISWSIFSLIDYICQDYFNNIQIGMLGLVFNIAGTIVGLIFSLII